MANSGFRDEIFWKAMEQPWAASSSGWIWVSVKKTKSSEPGFSGAARIAELPSQVTRGNTASAALEVARVFRNLRRPEFMDSSRPILTALVQDAEAANGRIFLVE